MDKTSGLPFNKGHTLITLTINQYKQFNDYLNNHRECMIVQNKYNHSGAINGAYTLIFNIKTINDIVLVDIFYKCNGCGEILEITNNDPNLKDIDLEALKIKYKAFIDYELVFTDDEKEKFDEIFVENNGCVEVKFTPNGLSNIIEVNGEEISNNDTW